MQGIESESQTMEWDKIFATQISGKGFVILILIHISNVTVLSSDNNEQI